ncbi:MAG: LON peptidase substrate-binding domain-containing protein [Planctomycetes bacterium]|nr:LON peptidase substrate-binding domain-containing protein [Planctomycetota bacterium]
MDVQLPSSVVPIFPMPGAFLFPHQVMPLHVFEPRYRQLVEDLLDGPGRLVIGTQLLDRRDATGAPELLDVAGFGEILRHQRLADGRYQILVLGLARVRFTEVPSDRLYRQVRCHPFVEIEAAEREAEDLTRRLRDATTARLKQPLPLPDSAPPGLLADLLLQTLRAPQAVVERAYVEPSVTRRARLVLQAARRADAAAGDAATE